MIVTQGFLKAEFIPGVKTVETESSFGVHISMNICLAFFSFDWGKWFEHPGVSVVCVV